MKRLVQFQIGLFVLAVGLFLAVVTTVQAGYYQDVYCYPTGTYWQAQIAAYPEYYAANDAYYQALYGPTTWYCTG